MEVVYGQIKVTTLHLENDKCFVMVVDSIKTGEFITESKVKSKATAA